MRSQLGNAQVSPNLQQLRLVSSFLPKELKAIPQVTVTAKVHCKKRKRKRKKEKLLMQRTIAKKAVEKIEMETHNPDLELFHFQNLFSSHFDSELPPLPLMDAHAAPVFVRGRRYALYAEKREARIRQRLAKATYSPLPPPAKKKVSFDHVAGAGHTRVLQRVENEMMRSVPDFSAFRKENKKPVTGSPVTPYRTPSRNVGGIRTGKKEVGLVRRSYATINELKGFSSPSQQSFDGGRIRGVGLRGGY